MKIISLAALFCIGLSQVSFSQSLQIIGFNSDNPDQIKFRVIGDISGGTVFYITDNEWSSANEDFNDLNEDEFTWTAPAGGLADGSTILIQGITETCGTVTGTPALATDGEEIYILSVVPSTTNGSVTTDDISFAIKNGGTGSLAGIESKSVNLGDFDNAIYNGGDITQASSWTTSNTIIDLGTGNCIALPIALVSFKVINYVSVAQISFSTATEIDNDYFSIQRSPNGRDYSEIGQVKGAGTSYEPQDYTFTDERPLQGKNYYRLKQVDFDGKYTYSPVVTATFGKASLMTLAPMPATETLLIQLEKPAKDDGIWQVYDMNGRLLLSGEMFAETTEQPIHIAALPEGAYVLRLAVGQVMVEQFRKN